MGNKVKSLYRALLRESRLLPDDRSRDYFSNWTRSNFRGPAAAVPGEAESTARVQRRLSRARKLARDLRAANEGYQHALQRAIELAYGIRGPTKHYRLQALLPDSPRRADYAFPPALSALVTSPIAHFSRPPKPAELLKPPKMPERADPTSEEARLLGPLTPERRRAIKRRWYNSQIGKVHAPVFDEASLSRQGVTNDKERRRLMRDLGIESRSEYDDLEVYERLERFAKGDFGTTDMRDRLARLNARPKVTVPPRSDSKWHAPKTLTERFMARRYADALAQLPLLKFERDAKGMARPTISRSPFSAGEHGGLSPASEEDLYWARKQN